MTNQPTNTHDFETWVHPNGLPCKLVPVPTEGDGEWFAEEPGQRPPQSYELRPEVPGLKFGFTVHPGELWSAYDAISDELVRTGWHRDTANDEPYRECEHGLSADLCSGPNHY